jgi:hypothetical protein
MTLRQVALFAALFAAGICSASAQGLPPGDRDSGGRPDISKFAVERKVETSLLGPASARATGEVRRPEAAPRVYLPLTPNLALDLDREAANPRRRFSDASKGVPSRIAKDGTSKSGLPPVVIPGVIRRQPGSKGFIENPLERTLQGTSPIPYARSYGSRTMPSMSDSATPLAEGNEFYRKLSKRYSSPPGPGSAYMAASKGRIERPLERSLGADFGAHRISLPPPPSTASGFSLEPRAGKTVQAGLVNWEDNFVAAVAKAGRTNRPVLLFQMMGKLNDEFC